LKGIIKFLLLGLFLLTGCINQSEKQTAEQRPKTIHDVFLLYKEQYVNGEDLGQQSFGDLYLLQMRGKQRKLHQM
jgi:hypothetical protein